MAEKILNTRLQLKIDTFANWSLSNETTQANKTNGDFVLKHGEIGLCEIKGSDSIQTVNPNGLSQTQVLFKVGDGTTPFKNLQWASALAADVYSWAKKSETDFITWVNTIVEHPAGPDLTSYLTANDITTGTANGTIAVRGNDVAVQGLQDAAYTTIESLNATAKSYADAVEAKLPTSTDYGVLSVTDGDDTITIGGTSQNPTIAVTSNKFDASGAAAQALTDAKRYTDDEIAKIPEQTDYTVTISEDITDSTIAKRYIFTQLGEEIGRIDLAKELVVTSGSVKEVETADMPYTGAKVGDKYIELVIANQDAPIYVPAKDLVDIYTAKELTTESTDEVKIAISNTNEISATLVDGKIAKTKLATNVQESLGRADNAAPAIHDHAGQTITPNEIRLNTPSDDPTGNGVITMNGYGIDFNYNGSSGYGTMRVSTDGIGFTRQDHPIFTVTHMDYEGNAYIKLGQSTVNNTEFGYLTGVTRSIQEQLDEKISSVDIADQITDQVNELANGAVKANTDAIAVNADAIAAINNEETGILAQAKTEATNQAVVVLAEAQKYTDNKIDELAAITKTGNVNDLVQTEGDVLIFNCGTSTTVI